ncbi:MAG: triose-phosphate isomerase, partial [Acidimicrobiia bacterium]
ETLAEREAGDAAAKVERQLRAGLAGLTAEQVAGMVIAYEPIWAIGTGRTATPEDAQEMCARVRAVVGERFGDAAAAGLRVQYGGSVRADNIAALMAGPDVDGVLVVSWEPIPGAA